MYIERPLQSREATSEYFNGVLQNVKLRVKWTTVGDTGELFPYASRLSTHSALMIFSSIKFYHTSCTKRETWDKGSINVTDK